jgi:hypothetical protein
MSRAVLKFARQASLFEQLRGLVLLFNIGGKSDVGAGQRPAQLNRKVEAGDGVGPPPSKLGLIGIKPTYGRALIRIADNRRPRRLDRIRRKLKIGSF